MPPVAAAGAALLGTTSLFGVAAATSVLGIATGTLGFAALKVGVGFLVNTAISALTTTSQSRGRVNLSEVISNLTFPTSRPAYRYILGNVRTNCTPLPFPVVGNNAYGCWLVQSRPTDGDMDVFINNQQLTLTGDPYDFSGNGATVVDGPFSGYVNVFIGRGDQTSPPQMFLDEAGYDSEEDDADLRFKETDRFTGRTVIFAKMNAGPSESRSERWGGGVPTISVSGELTNVFDPRVPSHNLNDRTTWEYSDNQALIALDVLTQNPFRPYRERHLDLVSWMEAANDADQLVPVKGGGTIRRYRAAGVVTFEGSEIEDIINPIMLAGASQLSRLGGLLGVTSGVWKEPTHTITESLSDILFSTDDAAGDKPTEARAQYTPETRPLESAETPIYIIDGALDANGGEPVSVSYDLGWVPDHRQAQRVLKILALQARESNTLQVTGLPDDLVLIAGSTTNVGLPDPFGRFMNGKYKVESIGAGTDILGEDGLALRSGISLRSTGSHIFEWNAELEEQDVYDPTFDSSISGVAPVGSVSITTGNTVNDTTGQVVIPRAKFEFNPSTSDVISYEVQSARQLDDYSETTLIDKDVRNNIGKVFGFISGESGVDYKARFRAVTSSGASDWVEVNDIVMVVDINLTAPTPISAVGQTGEIDLAFTASLDPDLQYTEIWGSDVDSTSGAVLLEISYVNQNETIEYTETGLGSGETRYYFGRTRGPFNSASQFSASISATTLI